MNLPDWGGLSNLRLGTSLRVQSFLVRAWEGMYIYGHPPSKAVASPALS